MLQGSHRLGPGVEGCGGAGPHCPGTAVHTHTQKAGPCVSPTKMGPTRRQPEEPLCRGREETASEGKETQVGGRKCAQDWKGAADEGQQDRSKEGQTPGSGGGLQGRGH